MVFRHGHGRPVPRRGSDDPAPRLAYAGVWAMSGVVLFIVRVLSLVILVAIALTVLSMWIWPAP